MRENGEGIKRGDSGTEGVTFSTQPQNLCSLYLCFSLCFITTWFVPSNITRESQVVCVANQFLFHWQEPLQNLTEPLLKAYQLVRADLPTHVRSLVACFMSAVSVSLTSGSFSSSLLQGHELGDVEYALLSAGGYSLCYFHVSTMDCAVVSSFRLK